MAEPAQQQRPQDPTAREQARQAVQCSVDRQDGGGPAGALPPITPSVP